MNITTPVVTCPIRVITSNDQDRLWSGLQALGSEDPTFRAYSDRDGRLFLAGMGELHLQIIVDRLKREYGVEMVTGNPQVAYWETVTTEADGEAASVGYSGGAGDSARVSIHVSPLETGAGYVFVSRLERLMPEVGRAVDEGIRAEAMNGILTGGPLDDLRVDLYEVSPEGGASEAALRRAGATALRDALRKARPVLLEPIMRVELNVPDVVAPDVMADLAQRGAEWQSEDLRGVTRVIAVRASMSRMLGYAAELRERTDGRGTLLMRVEGYRTVQR